MNTNCPNCGALYNVAEKDIGRKLKCKKCSTALKVTSAGLEVDSGTGPAAPGSDPRPAPIPAAEIEEEDEGEEERDSKRKKKDREKGKDRDRDRDRDRGDRGPAVNPLAAIGGLPTLLFGVGVFFVIFFTFMEEIGRAGTARADAGVSKLMAERSAKIRKLLPKGKSDQSELSEDERKKFNEDSDKIRKDYAPLLIEAAEDAEATRISNVRSVWMERYGLMFGFMFVAFGCLGYLRTEEPLVLRIVAAVILAFMMIVVFSSFGGCGNKPPITLPIPKGGGGKGGGPGPIEG
jgi:predicted Zn finger-like uncharacterized protein